jgi:hypothetical protein
MATAWAEVVKGRTLSCSALAAGVGKARVLVLPFAAATTPPPEGKTENVVPPDPVAAAPPATMVVEPPTTIPCELPSFWKVTPDAIAMAVLVAGAPVAGLGKRKVLVCPFATASTPLPEGKTENVVPDPTAADPPATIVVEPPMTIPEELPPFWNVTPGAMAIGAVLVEGAFAIGVGKGAVLVLPSTIT